MSETLITVENVSKKFCRSLKKSLWYGVQDLGNELRGRRHGGNGELRPDEFWAIRDISFEVKRGECLGLIGRNGAGKSTLLKILTGLLKPDEGRASLRGRVGALIELGGGFNPILTGRENIYIGGSVYGLSRTEMDKRIDEIIDFSELEEFIDTPLRNYSSGMKVRLGFSVATHIDPDVLFLDEVLSVGDAGFRIKSYNKMNDLMQRCAVIFVNHSMQVVARASNTVMLLEDGGVGYYGPDVADGIERYMDLFEGEKSRVIYEEKAQIHSACIRSLNRDEKDDAGVPILNYLDDLLLEVHLSVHDQCKEFIISFSIADKNMRSIAAFSTKRNGVTFENQGTPLHVEMKIPKCQLTNGEYYITISVHEPNHAESGLTRMPTRLAEYTHYLKFKVRGLKGIQWVPIYLTGNVKATPKALRKPS